MIGLIEFNQQTQKKRNWLKTAAVGAGAIGAVAGGGMLLKKRLAKGVPAPKQPKPDVDTSGLDAARKKLMDNVDSLGSPEPPKPPKPKAPPRPKGVPAPANTPTPNLDEMSKYRRSANRERIQERKRLIESKWGEGKAIRERAIEEGRKKKGWSQKRILANANAATGNYLRRTMKEKYKRYTSTINFSFVRGPLANEQPRYSGGAVLLGGAGLHQAVNSAALGTGRRKTNISNKIGKGKSAAITGGLAAAALGGAAHLQNRRDKYLRQRGYKVKSHFAKGAATTKRFSSKKEQLK